jgi:hypothetical protein
MKRSNCCRARGYWRLHTYLYQNITVQSQDTQGHVAIVDLLKSIIFDKVKYSKVHIFSSSNFRPFILIHYKNLFAKPCFPSMHHRTKTQSNIIPCPDIQGLEYKKFLRSNLLIVHNHPHPQPYSYLHSPRHSTKSQR